MTRLVDRPHTHRAIADELGVSARQAQRIAEDVFWRFALKLCRQIRRDYPELDWQKPLYAPVVRK